MTGRRPLLLLLLALGAPIAPHARADGGRTPVWTATTLSAPGHYYVTRDLTGPPPVLVISSPDVVLDLDGHTVTATSTSFAAIFVQPASGTRGTIEVRGGRVRGGSRNVWYSGPSGPASNVRVRLLDLDLSAAGESPLVLQSARSGEITRCRVHDSGAITPGIVVEALFQPSTMVTITDSVVSNVGGGGIRLDRVAAGAVRNTLVDRWSTAMDQPGISVEGAGTNAGGFLLEGNTLRGANASAQGIVLQANAHRTAVRRNVVSGAIAAGLVAASSGNQVSHNVIGVTGAQGVSVTGSDNRLEANQVTSSSGNGVSVSGTGNHLEGNTIEGNGGWGLVCSGATNAYRGNMLRNNGSGAVSGTGTDAGGNIP